MGHNTVAYIRNDLAATLESSPKTVTYGFSYPPYGNGAESRQRWLDMVNNKAREHGEPLINPDAILVRSSEHADYSQIIESSDKGIRAFLLDWDGPRRRSDRLPDGTKIITVVPAHEGYVMRSRCSIAFFLNDMLNDLEDSPKTVAQAVANPPNGSDKNSREAHRIFLRNFASENNEKVLHPQVMEVWPTAGTQYFIAGGNCIYEAKIHSLGKKRLDVQPIVLELFTAEYNKQTWLARQWLKVQRKNKKLGEVSKALKIETRMLNSYITGGCNLNYHQEKSILDYISHV